jgi:hypothetical protein
MIKSFVLAIALIVAGSTPSFALEPLLLHIAGNTAWGHIDSHCHHYRNAYSTLECTHTATIGATYNNGRGKTGTCYIDIDDNGGTRWHIRSRGSCHADSSGGGVIGIVFY